MFYHKNSNNVLSTQKTKTLGIINLDQPMYLSRFSTHTVYVRRWLPAGVATLVVALVESVWVVTRLKYHRSLPDSCYDNTTRSSILYCRGHSSKQRWIKFRCGWRCLLQLKLGFSSFCYYDLKQDVNRTHIPAVIPCGALWFKLKKGAKKGHKFLTR